jgi:hypothetical protein
MIQVGRESPIYLWRARLNPCLRCSRVPSVCLKIASALPRCSGGAAIPTAVIVLMSASISVCAHSAGLGGDVRLVLVVVLLDDALLD